MYVPHNMLVYILCLVRPSIMNLRTKYHANYTQYLHVSTILLLFIVNIHLHLQYSQP